MKISEEIKLADNIYYQIAYNDDGGIHHNVKYKVKKDLVVAIGGVNRVFNGYFRIVLRLGEKGFKNEIYFQFWVTNKDGSEDYNINSKYENIEVYFPVDEGMNFINAALSKFEEILTNANA